jgi:predicted amidohydrolase YtcJ
MNRFVSVIIGLIAISCMKARVDLVLINGRIYTVNSVFNVTQAMAVREGKIIATGNNYAITSRYEAIYTIDLHGKPVYPGFIDAHCHFYGYGLNLQQTDLTGTTSVDEIISRLKEHRKKHPSVWIIGRGWDQNDFSDRKYPHRSILDKHFPDIPVCLSRIDGHAVYVNSTALKLAGITKESAVEGGEILSDQNGPTGILIDNAIALVERYIPIPAPEQKIEALLEAQRNCFAAGLTTVGDAGLDKDIVLLIDSLQQQDMLKMRFYVMLAPTQANLSAFVRGKKPYVTSSLSVRSVKLYADGALGSRGALLSEPYSDSPGHYGLMMEKEDYYRKLCRLAYENGFQVNTHCIGDSAVHFMLNIYGSVLSGENDRRWRIEHSQVVHPDDYQLFTRWSVIPSVQTTHATSDMYWAEERLGPDRIQYAYAYKALLNCMGWLPNGSDFPVESINPVLGFYAAVARKDLAGFPPEGFGMENALNREEALKAMTIWAAKACFEERSRGSLEPGKVADFVILDSDIMTVDEKDIPGAAVVATYVNGEKVYSR